MKNFLKNKLMKRALLGGLVAVLVIGGVFVYVDRAARSAEGDGFCNGSDATITTPASGAAVGGTAVNVAWTFNGIDCTTTDPSVLDVEVSHDGGGSWVAVAVSALPSSTSVTFNSTAGSTPDDTDYQFRLKKGGSIVNTTAYSDVIIDNTAPVIASAETYDNNPTNGVVDRIKVTFTEPIGMDQTNTDTTGWYVTANDAENAYTISSISWIDSTHMYLNLAAEATHTTSVTPQVGYNGSGTSDDLAGNEVTTTSVANATDKAAPYVAITAPVAAERVTSADTVSFTSTELTAAECSTDNAAWEACASGAYAFSANAEFVALADDATFTLYVRDTDGGANVGTASVASLVKDITAPTVGIVFADTAMKVGETSLVTITFSEAVTGFANGDITTMENGTMTPVSSGDGGVTWTSTFTPSVTTEDNSNVITIDKTQLTDIAGNAGVGTTSSPNYAIDTLAPDAPTGVNFTAVGGVPVANTANTTNTSFTGGATITAGQATGGYAELLIGGLAFSTPVLDSEILVGDGTVAFDAGAIGNPAVQTQLGAGGVLSVKVYDAAGNSTVSTVANPTITTDWVVPTITSVLPAASTSINTQQVSYTLSEAAVAASGVIVFTWTSGTADAGSPHTCTLQGAALNVGAHTNMALTTNADRCVENFAATPLLDGATYTATFNSSDAAGNPAVQVSNASVTYDTTAPTLPVANIVGTTITAAGDTIVLTFDEPVVAADGTWSTNEITSITGTVSGALTLTTANFSYLGNALTITLNEATDGEYIKNGEDLTVDPAADAIKDLGGTSLADAAVVGTTNVGGDVTGPTVALTYSPDAAVYRDADSVTITATFNEAIEEGTVPTIAIAAQGNGGVLATNMIKTSNTVWTYAWDVPTGADDDGTATMTIAATDYAGNNNQAASNATKIVDNTKPAISALNVNDAAINAANAGADAFVVTIDFNDTMAATAPTVVFDPLIDTTMTNCSGVWTDTNTYTYTCDVVDADLESANIDINVSGAVDDGGNTMDADVATSGLNKFSVDTVTPNAPTVVTFTTVGAPIIANYVNTSNTNFTGGATIPADQAVGGTARWFIDTINFPAPLSDAAIAGGETSVTFNAGLGNNGDVQTQIPAGAHVLTVQLCDAANNCITSSDHVDITADYTNPASAATIANALYGSTTYVADTVNGTASDASGISGVTITIQEGAGNYWDGNSWEVGVTNLPAVGTTAWTYNSATAITHTDTLTYTVTPTATDTAGNSVAGTADTYTWDGSIPTITSYNSDKINGSYKAGEVIDVDVTFSEAVTTASAITLTMDTGGTCVIAPFNNSATATCNYTVGAGHTSADLTVSTFSAAGAVTDQAGNIMVSFTPTGNNLAANKAFIIDTTAPSVTMGTDPGTKAVTWSQNTTVTDTNMAGIVYAWTATLEPYTVTFGTAASEDTTISAGGIGYYTVQLTATDLAGNVGTGSVSFTWTSTNVPIASYSPVNGATGVAVAAGNATITFGGSENITLINATKVTIVKDSDGSDVANGAVSVSGGNNTSKILLVPHDALENNTIYRINILAGAVRDATGHINSEGVSYFTTVATGDVTAPPVPVITTTLATVNADSYMISGTAGADTPSDTARTVQVFNGATLAGTANVPVGQTAWSVYVSLTQNAANTFTAKSVDTYGNLSAASTSVVITEDPTSGSDVTAPPVPAITTTLATVNADSYVISGTAGADTPGATVRTVQVYNGATLAGTATVPVGQTAWSVYVSLTQSSANSFSATSADVYGNTSAASTAVVITESAAAGADVTAPPVPAITTTLATVNADSYVISGTAGADTPSATVRTVQVYNGATLVATANVPVGQTAWSVYVSLNQGAANSFTATAADVYGNTSAASTAVVITEDPNVGADITAPTFDSQAPAAGATGVSVNPEDLYVAFSEALDPNSIGSDTVKLCLVSDAACATPVSVGSPQLMENGTMIRIGGPSITLTNNTAYWFKITTGITDLVGNHLATAYGSNVTSNFTTVAAPNGSFGVMSSTMIKMTGTANDSYDDGWEWVIRMTLPNNQNDFALKFNNWVSGSNTLAAANNIKYYSEQIAAGTGSLASPITVTAADTYPSNVTVATDDDTNMDGIQTNIHIMVKIPNSTSAGSYSTSYRVNYE